MTAEGRKSIVSVSRDEGGLSAVQLERSLKDALGEWFEADKSKVSGSIPRILIIPPDYSRKHSEAGRITAILYKLLIDFCKIDILPAVGSHEPMSRDERLDMFGSAIPDDCYTHHDWKKDVVQVGEIPAHVVAEVSEGAMEQPVKVEVNRMLIDGRYDLIISIGQVVPHEVAGMANYSKNVFVGCGGWNMISTTHMLGAIYGMERIMGRDRTPVRKLFDYAEEHFLEGMPLLYILTVTTKKGDETAINGLFIGRGREVFEKAVALSQELNIVYVNKPIRKVVTYLDEKEFKSTWVGNKAIYRTRMAISNGGELLILAPGVRKFGEDANNDVIIRKYGYKGRECVMECYRTNEDMACNLSAAAHLIHGSSDGRFTITYAVSHLSRDEVEGAGFKYMRYDDAVKRYDPGKLNEGYNTMADGEEIYFIGNPALGLWVDLEAHTLD